MTFYAVYANGMWLNQRGPGGDFAPDPTSA
jgi:hypothetical protein